MPANKTRNTLLRQWELLKMLPSHGTGKSAKELADAINEIGFEVSKRQVERDLQALRESFPLDCDDRSPPYGWRWADGASANLPGLTLAESLSMRVVEDTLRPLLPLAVLKTIEPRFRQAAQKLAAHEDNNRTASWANKVRTVAPTLSLVPPHIPADMLATIQDALLADEQVEVQYQALGKDQPKALTLNPLGLVQRGPVSYLVATAFEYTEPRLFAVHRISSANRLHVAVLPSPGFNLDAYIQSGALNFGSGGVIRLEARVKDKLARILEETPLSVDQTLDHGADGGYLTATVMNTDQLHWWILSQGPGIEVIAPLELREVIAKKLAEAASIYHSDGSA